MRRFLAPATALVFGLAPAIVVAAPDPSPPNQATTPAIPDATVGKAGAALHDLAKLQEKYEGKIESATPQEKQSLNTQANAEAVRAIQSHGLSVPEYSNVMLTAQSDPTLRKRVLDAASSAP